MVEEYAKQIMEQLVELKEQGKTMFITSSFQTQSLPLLHILSRLEFKIPVAFIDTGYLFPETYIFKNYLEAMFELDIKLVKSNVDMNDQKDRNQRLIFTTNPERCCQLNKVSPMQEFSRNFDIWISGVRRDQSATRRSLDTFQKNTNGTMRYHPMLDWTSKMVFEYRQLHQLPEHPLEAQGYLSVGCMPCTSKYLEESHGSRGGRWQGMKKQECGLHTTLAK